MEASTWNHRKIMKCTTTMASTHSRNSGMVKWTRMNSAGIVHTIHGQICMDPKSGYQRAEWHRLVTRVERKTKQVLVRCTGYISWRVLGMHAINAGAMLYITNVGLCTWHRQRRNKLLHGITTEEQKTKFAGGICMTNTETLQTLPI